MRVRLSAAGALAAVALGGCGSSSRPDPPPLGVFPRVAGTRLLSTAPGTGDDTATARFRSAVITGAPKQSAADLMRAELRLLHRDGWGQESSTHYGGPFPGHMMNVAPTSAGALVMLDSPGGEFYVGLGAARTLVAARAAAMPDTPMRDVPQAIHEHRPALFIWLGHGRHD